LDWRIPLRIDARVASEDCREELLSAEPLVAIARPPRVSK
jgi:hypothetical protein